MTNYLYAAYVATWVIHIGYLLILTRRWSRLKQEAQELRKE